jgi:hypothetical protein
MQIKTTLKFPVTIVIIKNTTKLCVVKDLGENEPLYTAGANAS